MPTGTPTLRERRDSTTKNPVKARAGRLGAVKRWGAEPRLVRLDSLTASQRRLVLALIDAAKAEGAS